MCFPGAFGIRRLRGVGIAFGAAGAFVLGRIIAGTLPGEVQAKVEGVPGVASADVEIVWDPVWNPSMMSEAARLELGMM